jgi:hypothetical protein
VRKQPTAFRPGTGNSRARLARRRPDWPGFPVFPAFAAKTGEKRRGDERARRDACLRCGLDVKSIAITRCLTGQTSVCPADGTIAARLTIAFWPRTQSSPVATLGQAFREARHFVARHFVLLSLGDATALMCALGKGAGGASMPLQGEPHRRRQPSAYRGCCYRR